MLAAANLLGDDCVDIYNWPECRVDDNADKLALKEQISRWECGVKVVLNMLLNMFQVGADLWVDMPAVVRSREPIFHRSSTI